MKRDSLIYQCNEASEEELEKFLNENANAFVPRFNISVNTRQYAKKLVTYAIRFEVWKDDILVALLAVYKNDECQSLYIPYFCVTKTLSGKGIGKTLFMTLLEQFPDYRAIRLEVRKSNIAAYKFYERLKFNIIDESDDKFLMLLQL